MFPSAGSGTLNRGKGYLLCLLVSVLWVGFIEPHWLSLGFHAYKCIYINKIIKIISLLSIIIASFFLITLLSLCDFLSNGEGIPAMLGMSCGGSCVVGFTEVIIL